MFAVVVTFEIKSSETAEFLTAMKKNAQTSLANETGCHQFDVCTDPDRPNEVFLYELYTDEAAFDVHRSSTHFRDFNAQVGTMISRKDVKTYSVVAS